MRYQGNETTLGVPLSRKAGARFSILLGCALAASMSTAAWAQNSYPHLPPELNRIPDQNQANDINSQQARNKNFEVANAARKKQLNDESLKLLKLAADLKAEVDRTDQDTLSIGVIRRADEIEKLAHDIKEKMRLTVGGS